MSYSLNIKGIVLGLISLSILLSFPYSMISLLIVSFIGVLGIFLIFFGKHQLRLVTPYKTIIIWIGMLAIAIEAILATNLALVQYFIVFIVGLNILWACAREVKKKHYFNFLLGIASIYFLVSTYEFKLYHSYSLMTVSFATIATYSIFIALFVFREFSLSSSITNLIETILVPIMISAIFGIEYWALSRAASLGFYMLIVTMKGRGWVVFLLDGKTEVQ